MRSTNRVSDRLIYNYQAVFTDSTASANIAAGYFPIDIRSSGAIGGAQTNTVGALYNYYVFSKAVCTWLPKCSAGDAVAGGRIYIGYIDNPEDMATFIAAGNSTKLAYVKAIVNHKSWNAWQKVAYRAPLTRRRPFFDVNSTNDDSVSTLDRSTQGMIVYAMESLGATDTLGKWETQIAVKFHGQSAFAT